jgi:hypothetical protein
MRYGWLVVAVFAARYLVTAIAYPQVDGDLSWQRRLGETILRGGGIPHALGAETFTAAGAPWLPHEWLFSVGAALATNGVGWVLFSGTIAGCAIAALALSALWAERRGASSKAIALCTACAGIALFMSFGVRVQVAAWPLLVAFIMLLECEGPVAWWALLVAAVWSNVHGSAVLAPLLAGIVAAGLWLNARRLTPRVVRTLAIAAASLPAICLNPLGWKLPAYALMLMHSPIRANISEWQATGIGQLSFAYGALPLLLIVVLCGKARRDGGRFAGWDQVFIIAAFSWLLLGAARNIALFALVASPAAAVALTHSFRWFARDETPDDPRHAWIPRFALPAIALGCAVVLAVGLLRGQARAEDDLAGPAIRALARAPGDHRVLCTDFAWCGVLVGRPHIRVFLDGRADPYPGPVWDAYLEITRLRPAWKTELRAHGVDTVLAGRDGPLDQALAAVGGWRAAYADKQYRLWLLGPRSGGADTHRYGVEPAGGPARDLPT